MLDIKQAYQIAVDNSKDLDDVTMVSAGETPNLFIFTLTDGGDGLGVQVFISVNKSDGKVRFYYDFVAIPVEEIEEYKDVDFDALKSNKE